MNYAFLKFKEEKIICINLERSCNMCLSSISLALLCVGHTCIIENPGASQRFVHCL